MHLCIDMQRLYAEATLWSMPWLPRVLPQVHELAKRHPSSTIFTRFVPPETPSEAAGAWRAYYERWPEMTRTCLDPRLLELVEPLAVLVPPARILDKSVYSAFEKPNFARALHRRGITTLIVTGGETDVCVLSTVMGAIDRGFRVVLPTDALCSVNDGTHDALLKLYHERFSSHVEATTVDDVLRRWDCRD
jgi:nicotinamidase-related amidase